MKKIYFFAAAALALAACSNDDKYADNGPVAAQITANIGESTMSRATGTAWDKGDKIGITTFRENEQGVNESKYVNMEYITENADGVFTGTPMYFQDKTKPVDFVAYYPFTGTQGEAPSPIEAVTSAENQTAINQPKIDFLYDHRKSITGSNPKVNFVFSHRMSKLTFTFKNGTGADVSKITSYAVEGLTLTGSFNPADGTATASGDAATLTMENVTVTNGASVPSLIVFPQNTGGKTVNLHIYTNDNQHYACQLQFGGGEILCSNDYQYTITVNRTGLNLDKSTIADWGVKLFNGDATLQ